MSSAISVFEEVFGRLSSDVNITDLLEADSDGGYPIYMDWGLKESPLYIIITYLPANEVYAQQAEMELQIDIYDRRAGVKSYAACLEVAGAIHKNLDTLSIRDGGLNLRAFFNSEQPVPEDLGKYRRYSLSFALRYNRTADLIN